MQNNIVDNIEQYGQHHYSILFSTTRDFLPRTTRHLAKRETAAVTFERKVQKKKIATPKTT